MIETLNRDCHCETLDRRALRRSLEPEAGALQALEERPGVFSASPVFVSRDHARRMAELVRAVEDVAALPAYRDLALARAPSIARRDPGARGVFMGYDFHIGAQGPRLIEINTNAGGALLNAVLARVQRDCCEDMAALDGGSASPAKLEAAFADMFVAEWRAAGRSGPLRRVAIVDESPERQFLYPEFLLFARLFARFGIESVVLAPGALAFDGRVLRDASGPIDLVYNRLTDFSLDGAENSALREAYLAGAAVVTPHPRAHALLADKRNLAVLTDAPLLRRWGVPESTIGLLAAGIARTTLVAAADGERLWAARRSLFFKPAGGYGGKAAYRGDKLTKRVWAEILAGTFVAQELVPPGERALRPDAVMKVDLRNYAYAGEVQLLAARVYQGQTTNFRTQGGGFAPVLMPPPPGRPT